MPEAEGTLNLLQELISAKHEAVMERLGAQDNTLRHVLSEAKRTNGRVNELEKKAVEQTAIAEDRRRHRNIRVDWVKLGIEVAAMLGAGAGGSALGHAAGWW